MDFLSKINQAIEQATRLNREYMRLDNVMVRVDHMQRIMLEAKLGREAEKAHMKAKGWEYDRYGQEMFYAIDEILRSGAVE